MSPKIAIIGAGPGGLTLASILIQNGITPTIYEHDASPSSRLQGGSLDLHPGTGQAALEACGLISQFKKTARYQDQDLTLGDKDGNRVLELHDKDTGRPEIDRGQLRQMLLDSIPEGIIKWNHHLVEATEDSLNFRDGHTETGFDLIVGADGAWSKIRPLCCYVTPYYTGVSAVQMFLHNSSVDHAAISEMVGKGTYYSIGGEDGLAIAFQRMDNDLLMAYAFGRRPEDWVKKSGMDVNNPDSIRAILKKDYEHWAPELTRVIDECDGNMPILPLYMLPLGLRWPSHKKVTIIGDAAHVMTPFSGEGVNLAMTDALFLANAIIANPNDIATAIRECEPKMMERANVAGTLAWNNTLLRFEKGGLEKWADRLKMAMERNGHLQLTGLVERKK